MDNITSLQITDARSAPAPTATAGKNVTVHYTGWLYDAEGRRSPRQEVRQLRDRDEPFAFKLGAGMVIRGWDQGVAGMKVGGTRTLVIPAGARLRRARRRRRRSRRTPTLVFDVELLRREVTPSRCPFPANRSSPFGTATSG